jgi:hypothetical protein
MESHLLLEKLQALPPDKQAEVLDFVDFLIQRTAASSSSESASAPFFGLWADLGVDLSADDIDEARREQWDGFPREDLP